MNNKQIKKYIGVYERRRDRPFVFIVIMIAVVFLSLTIFLDIINTLYLKLIICAVVIAFVVLFLMAFKAIRKKYLRMKLPFAIGSHVTFEVRDGYLNINCSGIMKGYPPNSLKRKVTMGGDYILTHKKDIIVIPKNVLTPMVVDELENYVI